MSAPAISVVVPTHDVRPWLDDCLDSILAQDVDLEVVLVDDRSVDGTYERALERARADSRLRVVRNLGSGGGQARNHGVELARGRWLAFADGDDVVPEGAYAAMLAAAGDAPDGDGVDMVVGRFLKFSSLRTWDPTATWAAFRRPWVGTVLDEPSLVRNRACWNRLIRRDRWLEEGIVFPTVARSNDIVPMITALLSARRVSVVPDVTYLYRDRPGTGSMTSRASAAASFAAYLGQELTCARLVAQHRHDGLRNTYWNLVLQADGWVAVTRYVTAAAGAVTDDDARVVERLRTLLELAPVERLERLTDHKRAAFELVAAGRHTLAARLVRSLDAVAVHDDVLGTFEELGELAGESGAAGVSSATLRTLVGRLVLEALQARGRLSEAEAHRLTAAARPLAPVYDADIRSTLPAAWANAVGPLVAGDVPRLVERSVHGFRTTVEATAVSHRRSTLRVEGTVHPPTAGPLVALATRSRRDGPRQLELGPVRLSADGTRWSVSIPARRLLGGGWWHLVVAPPGTRWYTPVITRHAQPAAPPWARVVTQQRSADGAPDGAALRVLGRASLARRVVGRLLARAG